MRRVMSDIISSEPGMTVANTADNGSTAVRYLESGKRYDCILLDINMPKMDGIGFLTYINEKRITIPVLVVSSQVKARRKPCGHWSWEPMTL